MSYDPYAPRSAGRGRGGRNSAPSHHGGYGRGGLGRRSTTEPITMMGRGSLPPTPAEVLTNLFPVQHFGNPAVTAGYQWYQYRLSVTPLKGRIKHQDEQAGTWKETMVDANPIKIERMKQTLEEKGSTERTRALFSKLSDELWETYNILLATDSASMGVSNKKIPLPEDQAGVFLIQLDQSGFRVTVQLTMQIPMGIFSHQPTTVEQLATADTVKQCLEIIVKYGLGRTCLSCDTNPQTFFLPEYMQRELARTSPLDWSRPDRIAPFEGITQSARYANTGEFVMVVNNKVDFLYREASANGEDIAIVNLGKTSTIAGVTFVMPGNGQVLPTRVLEEVEAALAKMTLKVNYQKGPGWERDCRQRLEAKGTDEDLIQSYMAKHRTYHVSHCKMIAKTTADGQKGERIKSSCAAETFVKDQVEHDIQSYFLKIYDIQIKYPQLPVVSIGGRGYFPVEFLYQEKSRVGGNSEQQLQHVLNYHDRFSGHDRADRVCEVKDRAYSCERTDIGGFRSLNGLLHEFQISIDQRPIKSPAQRLAAPRPTFSNGETADTKDGSWNLARKSFTRPAILAMPVILDFTKNEGRREVSVEEMTRALFSSMNGHGMSVCSETTINGAPGWRDLIYKFYEFEGYQQQDKIYNFVKGKVGEARERILGCSSPLFSCVVGTNGDVENTWIMKHGGTWFRIPPKVPVPGKGDAGESHLISSASNPEQTACARVQFLVRGKWQDPSDTGPAEIIERCDRFQIWTENGWIGVDGIDIGSSKPYSPLQDWQIECPTMILCYIPEYETGLYNFLKTICDISLGLNSQIIVKAKASAAKNLPQYCSNIALKINTKLFNLGNKAIAWTIPTDSWLSNNPTIVMGYSVAHGRINAFASTALAGSVCLFHPMQMGQAVKLYKSERLRDVVDSEALRDLISDLIVNHFAHTRLKAERILVYRDGGSRGSFEHIRAEEIQTIRKVWGSFFPKAEPPKITFVVSNKDHNINIMPASPVPREVKSKNVPSGTTVSVVEEFQINTSPDLSGEFSFLLTAQGGLKGTSKPMLYTCLVNENLSTGLDKAALTQLTYDLSFQYGSATKSPRTIPVLLNSGKLANRALAYGPYLATVGVDVGLATAELADDAPGIDKHFNRLDDLGSTVLYNGLYPSFGVRDSRCSTGPNGDEEDEANLLTNGQFRWRAPFRAHITA